MFQDRREFTGSLLRQMNEVYDFIDFRNQTRATINKLLRTDVRDYPETAVREALLNLLVHRDYSFSASALISIYTDRIEFVSVGGLLSGIELEDVLAGLSVCRNQSLADVFYQLRLIEAYGTGLKKMMAAYADEEEKPIIETTKNSFKVTLPNINAKYNTDIRVTSRGEVASSFPVPDEEKGYDDERTIWELARSRGKITRSDVEKQLEVSASTASRILRRMVKNKILIQCGQARSTKYTLSE